MTTTLGSTPIIHDGNWQQYCDQYVNGVKQMRGLIPRDKRLEPPGYLKGVPAMKGVDFPLIPRSEWAERIRDKEQEKSRLSDIRRRANNGQLIPSLDQNGQGYCWAYGTTAAVMLLRAVMNLPYVRLSAHAVACIVKGFRDEGGWGALSLDFIMQRGVPSVEAWPEKSMSRSNDKPATWEDAAKYKVTEGWVDLEAAVYDRNLSFEQEISLLLSNIPTVADMNWWGHCTVMMDAVDGATQRNDTRGESGKLLSLEEFDRAWGMNDPVTAGIGKRTWNSWTDQWGDKGEGLITGSKAVSDNCVAPRVV
jgi:hypothetical protein